jgi:hypothetical protein
MILAPVSGSRLMALAGQTSSHMAVSHCMQVEGTNSSWPSNWDLTTRILDRSGLHSFMLRSEQATSHI